MKTKTYEKIIDQFISLTVNTLLFSSLYLVSFGFFAAIAAIWFTMGWSGYWVYFASMIPSSLIFCYVVFFRRAVRRYGNVRLRDIWMYNATNLKYRATNEEVAECEEWIEENISGLHQIRTGALEIDSVKKRTFVFKKKSDAMAFKLVWEDKLTSIIK